MSSIPVTAGSYEFTPPSLCDDNGVPLEGAPVIVLRHGTRTDHHELPFLMQGERCFYHSQSDIRDTIVSELRQGWESEGLERNITLLEQYWQAQDEHAAALTEFAQQVRDIIAETPEGVKPQLPSQPTLDFDRADAKQLDLIVSDVQAYSVRVAQMVAMNSRWITNYPRMILRMLIKSTTLDVPIARRAGLLTFDCAEQIIEALGKAAEHLGKDKKTAGLELLNEAQQAYSLTGDEEKNSSAPRSGTSTPKASASKSTSKDSPTSKTAASTETEAG